jgi:uncharacterized RDD family membrane protein YckC
MVSRILEGQAPCAGLGRRLASLAYEALLAAAVVLAGSFPFVIFAQGAGIHARPLFQLYLVALTGAYFTWQWRRGRTLAMKTWRLKLVTRAGTALTPADALKRYLYALAGTVALGAGFLWALLDREGLFLHDRLAGTKIVKEEVESRKSEGTA